MSVEKEPFDKENSDKKIGLGDDLDVDFSRRKRTVEHSEEVHTELPRRSKNRKKRSVLGGQNLPPSVILLNIIMIVVVLGICLAVFIIMFNKSVGESSDSSDSSSVLILDSSGSVPQSSPGSSAQGSSVSSADSSVHDASSSTDIPSDNISSIAGSDLGSVSEPSAAESTGSGGENYWTSGEIAWTYVYNARYFKDDLFIGDSIYTGLALYGFIVPEHVAAAVGYTPYKAIYSPFGSRTDDSALTYAWKMQPKRIFIMLGSNGMDGGNHDYLVDCYNRFLSLLTDDCPDSTICIVSIPPVTADSSLANRSGITNEDISSVNARLEEMCEIYGAMYFDLNSLVSDDEGYLKKQYAEIDGLHFVRDTYVLMLSELEKFTSE